MKGYYICKEPKTGEIVYINYDKYKGYNITPKNKIKYDGIKVNKMMIVKPSMIEKLLKRKIKNRLDLYLRTIIEIMDESDSSDSSGIREALNELTRFKNIIKYKYEKHLEDRYITLLNKKIEILEYELKKKLMIREDHKKYDSIKQSYLDSMYRSYLNKMYGYSDVYDDYDELTSHRRR